MISPICLINRIYTKTMYTNKISSHLKKNYKLTTKYNQSTFKKKKDQATNKISKITLEGHIPNNSFMSKIRLVIAYVSTFGKN